MSTKRTTTTPRPDRVPDGLTSAVLGDFEAQEMATRESAARYNAHIVSERLKNESNPIIADITAGAGSDTLAFSQRLPNATVHAFEILAQRAQRLSAIAPSNVAVHCQSGLELWSVLDKCDFIYADPARRSGAKRTLNPEEFSPPLGRVLELGAEHSEASLMVKLAPGIAREHAQVWVAHKRELVQALHCSWEAPDTRRAVVLNDAGEVVYMLEGGNADASQEADALRNAGASQESDASRSADAARQDNVRARSARSENGAARSADAARQDNVRACVASSECEYIAEPNASIIRSGLVAEFAGQIGASFLDPHIAYLSVPASALVTAQPVLERSYSTLYQVRGVLPITPKKIRAFLRENAYTNATVKKRGVSIDPHAFRKELKISKLAPKTAHAPYKEAIIILLRCGEGAGSKRYAFICDAVAL